MKLSLATIALSASVAQAWTPTTSNNRAQTSLNMAKVYYASSTGNTETIAGYIATAAGLDVEDIGDAADDAIAGDDSLIMGAPTWHTGADEQRSGTGWDDWLYDNLPNIDVSGKKVAIFGCGDQASYAEYYCDAAGELYDQLTAAGAKVFGATSTDGYDHEDSKAVRDGNFIGLMCDEDNQYDLSEDRANAWVEQLKLMDVLEATHSMREEETAKMSRELKAIKKEKDNKIIALRKEVKALRRVKGRANSSESLPLAGIQAMKEEFLRETEEDTRNSQGFNSVAKDLVNLVIESTIPAPPDGDEGKLKVMTQQQKAQKMIEMIGALNNLYQNKVETTKRA